MPGTPKASSEAPQTLIPCCYQNCLEGALVRVWTKTGWANVCVKHYAKIEIVHRKSDVWAKSVGYEQKSVTTAPDRQEFVAELNVMREKMLASTREPGQDDEEPALGIPIDDLEREFADRANP